MYGNDGIKHIFTCLSTGKLISLQYIEYTFLATYGVKCFTIYFL